ncbi:MAG TPA: S46 family peptidase [Candidatus Krumholzibacteria bacterium]|nr:S46 family peptidase [Candidatus Krumholzibacteria bacterium]
MTRARLLLMLSAILVLMAAGAPRADEGMWTFDNPPTSQLAARHDFTPTQEWLDHLRLSAVKLGGGSGSFVSPDGLILTNAHVARGQQQKLSSADADYVRDGFVAKTRADELPCPDLEIAVLDSYEDVTARVLGAITADLDEARAQEARSAVIAAIEKESHDATGLRSDVVTLYHGGEYWLYRYRTWTDVRLVFAPESAMAYFGGDDDNFTYPRHDLDMALFRAYEDGKPAKSPAWLTLDPAGGRDGDLVFVAGHPGSTDRLFTMAELAALRDEGYPRRSEYLKDALAGLQEYAARGPEQARQVGGMLMGLNNGRKAGEGEYKGLLDPAVWAKKQQDEDDFRARVAADAALQVRYGRAWGLAEEAEAAAAARRAETEGRTFGRFGLAGTALSLVQTVEETQKPDSERMDGCHDAQLRRRMFRLYSPAPVYPELEEFLLARTLQRALDHLGPDDAFVQLCLAGGTPEARAHELIAGTKLADPAARRALVEGGPEAVAASTDPLVVLARGLAPIMREQHDWEEANVKGVKAAAGEMLGAARFAVYGKTTYPDATGTLRLSYGLVEGYPMNGTRAPAMTTFYGLYDRAYGFGLQDPFLPPSRWMERKDALDLAQPLDFVSTCDIIGGNSGSPVVDRKGRLVGLVFDGNIESLVGRFVYDEASNRCVAVHAAAIAQALDKLYDAGYLVQEMSRTRR